MCFVTALLLISIACLVPVSGFFFAFSLLQLDQLYPCLQERIAYSYYSRERVVVVFFFSFFLFYFPVLDLLLELWSTNSGERRDEETSFFLVVKRSRGRGLSLFAFWSFVDNCPVARHERKTKKLFYTLVCLQTL